MWGIGNVRRYDINAKVLKFKILITGKGFPNKTPCWNPMEASPSLKGTNYD